jgi:hypothetical protein
MIDRTRDLPIARQAKALNISRGAVYYKPRPISIEDLAIIRRIDRKHSPGRSRGVPSREWLEFGWRSLRVAQPK